MRQYLRYASRLGLGPLLAAAVIAGTVRSQVPVGGDWRFGYTHSFPGAGVLDAEVALIGDLDGDGFGDWILGYGHSPSEALVYSGRTGALIRGHTVPGLHTSYVKVARAGDLNLDGAADYFIGYPSYDPFSTGDRPGLVRAYSGVDGAILFEFTGAPSSHDGFGQSICSIGDVNGDSCPEFAYSSETGRVLIHDGATGILLFERSGSRSFGGDLASLADVDGDLAPELVIGDRLDSAAGFEEGAVFVLSIRTASYLHVVREAAGSKPNIGYVVTGLDDVDGDQVPDFATANGGTLTCIYSGATGAKLKELSIGSVYARSLSNPGDTDGDGLGDISVGCYIYDFEFAPIAGAVFVFSVMDDCLLRIVRGELFSSYFSLSHDASMDVDGDGETDLLVASTRSLRVSLLARFDPFLTVTSKEISSTVPAVQFVIDFPDVFRHGQYRLICSSMQANPSSRAGSVFGSVLEVPIEEPYDGWSSILGAPGNVLHGRWGILDSAGKAIAVLQATNRTPLVGRTFYIGAVAQRRALKMASAPVSIVFLP